MIILISVIYIVSLDDHIFFIARLIFFSLCSVVIGLLRFELGDFFIYFPNIAGTYQNNLTTVSEAGAASFLMRVCERGNNHHDQMLVQVLI